MKNYKILGGNKKIEAPVKNKMIITAKEFSASAIERVKEKGGNILIPEKN